MSNQDNEMVFAERLRAAREARGLNQAELARKLGSPPSAIAHFEGGRRKPSFTSVRAIAKALDVSADFLMGRTPSLKGATTVFRNEEHLSTGDREWIQQMIDARVKGNSK